MSEKELEVRLVISKEKFLEIEKYIKDNYPNYKLSHHKNRYFDDNKKTLRISHNVLRIRSKKEEGNRELTYKVKGEDGDLEYNQPLSYYDFRQIIYNNTFPKCEVIDKLAADGVDISSLKLITELITRRIEVFFDEYIFVLDANEYNNISDYDIEVESKISKSHAEEIIKKVCEQFSIEYKKHSPSKSRRAFESIGY